MDSDWVVHKDLVRNTKPFDKSYEWNDKEDRRARHDHGFSYKYRSGDLTFLTS